MYILQRKNSDGTLSYYKREGWVTTPQNESLDLSDCVLWTYSEVYWNRDVLGPNETFQYYGAYEELK